MDRDILLIIIGGVIGLLSSLISWTVAYIFEDRRIKRQWIREDKLRQEERRQSELSKAHDFTQHAQTVALSGVLKPNLVTGFLKKYKNKRIGLSQKDIDPELINNLIEEAMKEVNRRNITVNNDSSIKIPELKIKSKRNKTEIRGTRNISKDF